MPRTASTTSRASSRTCRRLWEWAKGRRSSIIKGRVRPKGGGTPTTAYGRSTYVYARRGRDWKIVSAHFSPLPK